MVNQYLFGKAREFSDLRHLCAYSRGNSGISASARQQKDFSAKTISFLTWIVIVLTTDLYFPQLRGQLNFC